MADEIGHKYNRGEDSGAGKSSVGKQLQQFYWYRKALLEIQKDQVFLPMADVRAMPKHYGKKISQYLWIPLLDDRNVNDQGIDASGAVSDDGNLYGTSKDIGNVTAKMPALSEEGGRVNRVGYTRKTIEGEIAKFGFFDEFTQESLDFDSEDDLHESMMREGLRGAHELTESAVQIDLLNGAGVVKHAGVATKDAEITGEPTDTSEVTYSDLFRLGIDLDSAKCPKSTTLIKGSTMTDTRVIPSARYIYCGSELLPTLMKMKDYHGNQAFVEVEKYAAGGNAANNEAGSIAGFRVIIVQEMLHWAGAGAAVTAPAGNGYRNNDTNYDVFPMLVVGSGSFTTIGFQTDGKTVKFRTIVKMPGEATADRNDPYGELGFHSIKWYYGSMILRPEWLAVVKTVAPM